MISLQLYIHLFNPKKTRATHFKEIQHQIKVYIWCQGTMPNRQNHSQIFYSLLFLLLFIFAPTPLLLFLLSPLLPHHSCLYFPSLFFPLFLPPLLTFLPLLLPFLRVSSFFLFSYPSTISSSPPFPAEKEQNGEC